MYHFGFIPLTKSHLPEQIPGSRIILNRPYYLIGNFTPIPAFQLFK